MGKNRKQQNTNKIFEQLHHELLYPAILFFPLKELKKNSDPKDIETLVNLLDPFDKLIFAESNNTINFLDKKSDLKLLLDKTKKLRKNTFDLVDYKFILTKKQFSAIIEKYIEYVNAYIYLSNLLLTIIESSKNNSYMKFTTFFQQQHQSFQKHLTDLEEIFATKIPTKTNVVVADLNLSNFLSEKFPIRTNQQKTKESLKRKTTTKQFKVDDLEIQIFLLDTIFNIKMTSIKK